MRLSFSFLNRMVFCAVCILSLTVCAVAQTAPGSPNEQDKNYVPDKTSIFNAEGKTGKHETPSASQDIHEIIAFNPFLIVRNIFALQYEHKFVDMFGVQGGLGFCYGKDYMQTVFGDVFSGSGSSGVDDKSILSKGFYHGPNLYVSLDIRLYFNTVSRYTYEDRTGYIEMGVRHYKNTMQLSDSTVINTGSASGGSFRGNPTASVTTNLFYLNYGYHFSTDGKIRTTHKFYFGLGIRDSKWNAFNTSQGNNYGSTYYTINPTEMRSSTNFVAQFGYELGIAYK